MLTETETERGRNSQNVAATPALATSATEIEVYPAESLQDLGILEIEAEILQVADTHLVHTFHRS